MRRTFCMTALVTLVTGLVGCATLQQIAALRQVQFSIDSVAGARLANVSIDRVRSSRELTAIDVANIGIALGRGELPLEFTLHLDALNPERNDVTARMVRMQWTLLLEDRETISGSIDREILFEPGIIADVPILIRVDLADFFQKNAQDMVELALAVSGAGGEPKRVALKATPTIQTVLGPITYPEPITIVSGTVGR